MSYLFEEVLDTPKKYPYVRGFQLPRQEEKKAESDLTLLLFVFDSTLPTPDARGLTRTDTLARGIIEADEVKYLVKRSKEIADAKEVQDLSGTLFNFDPANTIRVALLHHHPVVTWESHADWRMDTRCAGSPAGSNGRRRR